MILAQQLKNLVARILIICLSFLVFLMKEVLVSILPTWIREESGLKMKKETTSLYMQMVTLLRSFLFHLTLIKW